MYEWGIEQAIVWTPAGAQRQNVYVDKGKIVEITGALRPCRVRVDGQGKDLLPGMIDVHVHSRDPGLTEEEDWAHSTMAAAMGGITTILEMPNSRPALTNAAQLRERAGTFQENAWVDFGLWALLSPDMAESEIVALGSAGAVGFKLFWGYALDAATHTLVYDPTRYTAPVIPAPSVGDVLSLLETAQRTSRVVAVHAEDASIIRNRQQHSPYEVDSYARLLWEHPDVSENATIAVLIELARASGAAVHIVHLASSDMLPLIAQARKQGVDITVETAPHYLLWDADQAASFGAAAKAFPPIREARHRDGLREGIAAGLIDMVGSDHAPHDPARKSRSLVEAPAGIPGVQTLFLSLMHLALEGSLDFARIPEVLAYAPAKRFGLWPRKGAIQVGADADLVIVNRRGTTLLTDSNQKTLHPQKPWTGLTLMGQVEDVYLRGKALVHGGEFIAQDPEGQFLPSHAQPFPA